MSEQEDTPRGRRHYHESEQELRREGARAPTGAGERKENRERLGVNEEHKTEKMQKEKRGTYP
jgi:hypothetical protein